MSPPHEDAARTRTGAVGTETLYRGLPQTFFQIPSRTARGGTDGGDVAVTITYPAKRRRVVRRVLGGASRDRTGDLLHAMQPGMRAYEINRNTLSAQWKVLSVAKRRRFAIIDSVAGYRYRSSPPHLSAILTQRVDGPLDGGFVLSDFT